VVITVIRKIYKQMIDNQLNVKRLIRIYSNETEYWVADLELETFDLSYFQQLFHIRDRNNPMFDSYEITPQIIKIIEMHMDSKPEWNFEKYQYFIEAEAL